MKVKKMAILFIATALSLTACILDISGPESASPTIDSSRDQETESLKTQAFQEAVNTAVAATVSAMPTCTPIPTDTPEPTSTSTSSQGETPIAGSTRVPSSDRFDIPIDGQPFLGPENAPIIIVEFSDYNCGYCRKWHLETFQSLLDAYPGKIRFVYRDFPILSEESFNAAVAAQCAYEQGAFWGFHDALFTRSEPKGLDTYLLFAQELGLDIQRFEVCLESDRAVEEVLQDAQFASDIGVNGTPTFFINGIPLVGAQPIENFMTIMDQELGE
jgi:protein-disulfide isomerase